MNHGTFWGAVSVILLTALSTQAAEDVLRYPDGRAMYMNHFEALRACPAGSHLPTLRELAKKAEAWGAIGVWEAGPYVPSGEGYGLMVVVNPDGQMDGFSFSSRGYRSQFNDVVGFWSSSVEPTGSYGTYVKESPDAYALMDGGGYLMRDSRLMINAVLCLPGN